jgi:hypothetical protein
VCWFGVRHLPSTHYPSPSTNLFLTAIQLLPTVQMATTHVTDPSISNFTSIFEAAAKEYKRLTKKDLQTHPFAAQFDRCDSPGAVLGIFQNQAQAFDQLRNGDERLMKWLSLTIHILFTFSATLGEGIGLVSFKTSLPSASLCPNMFFSAIPPCKNNIYWYRCSPQRKSLPNFVVYIRFTFNSGGKGCCREP